MIRIPGQVGTIAGAVGDAGVVVTSGLVCPGVFTATAGDIDHQITGALNVLRDVLEQASSGFDRVMRVEAFLSRADHLPNWNSAFSAAFSSQPPARTTLITGFAMPEILFELQAIAACD